MVRAPGTYEWIAQKVPLLPSRTTLFNAAQLLPVAASAAGVTPGGIVLPLARAVAGTAFVSNMLYDKQEIKREFYNPPQYVEFDPEQPRTRDWISLDAQITVPVESVTPESFPQVESALLGRKCTVSVPLDSLVNAVNQSSDPALDPLKAIVNQSTTDNSLQRSLLDGSTVSFSDGYNYKMTYTGQTSDMAPSFFAGLPVHLELAGGACSVSGAQVLCWDGTHPDDSDWTWRYWVYSRVKVDGPPDYIPSRSINWPGLASALKNALPEQPELAEPIDKAVQQVPPKEVMVTDNPPSPSDPQPRTQTGPISQQEINNYYTTNYQNTANSAISAITDNSTTQEIAQNQAAVQAAQAKAQELPSSLVASGEADLPEGNDYSFELEEVPEQNLVERIHGLIDQGLPVFSTMQASGLTASGDPSITAEIYGRDITVDFSDYSAIFHTMGIMLTFCSVVLSYRIIVGS